MIISQIKLAMDIRQSLRIAFSMKEKISAKVPIMHH